MANNVYIGMRYIPNFRGEYDSTTIYETLDVVDNGLGTSYIAKRNVPAGTPLSNTTYWAIYGASSGAILDLQGRMDSAENDIDTLESGMTTVNNTLGLHTAEINDIHDDLSYIAYDYIVDAAGSGDYTSLAAAVAVAQDGYKIFVKAGIYDNEAVDMVGKFLTIVGEDRNSTIIRNSFDDYYRPPIEIDRGHLMNLTFQQTGTGGSTHAYAMHDDFDGSVQRSIEIDNCSFYSASAAAVGIGTRTGHKVTISNSKIQTGATDIPALFVHPSANSSLAGSGQSITLINTIIEAITYCIAAQKVGAASNILYIQFIGCALNSTVGNRTGLIRKSAYQSGEGDVIFNFGAGNNYPYLNQENYNSGVRIAGRWINNPVKRFIASGSCAAGVQLGVDLPNDCDLVISFTGYITNTSNTISYPFGVVNPDNNHYYRGYFVNNPTYKKAFIKSDDDGTYFLEVIYYSNNVDSI